MREKTGRKIHLWPGYCGVHSRIPTERIEALRQEHPKAELLIHPECGCSTPHMMQVDQMLSTEGIYKRPSVSKAPEFIVATEVGILHRLKRQYPDRTFHPGVRRRDLRLHEKNHAGKGSVVAARLTIRSQSSAGNGRQGQKGDRPHGRDRLSH